jgi:hypothetical protein
MGNAVAEVVVIIAIMAAIVIVACKLFCAYIDGYDDGEYNNVDGDWREGVFRRTYLAGLKAGKRHREHKKARRLLAETRASERNQ